MLSIWLQSLIKSTIYNIIFTVNYLTVTDTHYCEIKIDCINIYIDNKYSYEIIRIADETY